MMPYPGGIRSLGPLLNEITTMPDSKTAPEKEKEAKRSNLPTNLRGKPFVKGHDPRRNLTVGGRPSDEFTAAMRALASRNDVLAALEKILTTADDPRFLKAFAYCADRGYGKAHQSVEVTTTGPSIADILREGRERVMRMRNPEAT